MIFITLTHVCFDDPSFIGVINLDTSRVITMILLKPHNLFNATMNKIKDLLNGNNTVLK